MIDSRKVLAIIPARGGSKRLPNKNILLLNGKPLIIYTIEAALKSKYIDEVVVSTDSDKIADIAKKSGAKVPFIRPDHLSTDTVSSYDVLEHAYDYYKNNLNIEFNIIVLLQPTSPLRISEDIDNSLNLLYKKKADSVISIVEVEHPIDWCGKIGNDLSLKEFNKNISNKRSQELDKYYRLNGAVYASSSSSLFKNKTFFVDNSYGCIMSKNRSIDIDDHSDFDFAAYLLTKKTNGVV